MDDRELLNEFKKYFCLEELVDEEVFNKYGDTAWQFLDIRLLKTLLFIRVSLGTTMTINNWKWGGRFSQRGLRHNRSAMVKNKTNIYLSAHMLGKAADFDVKGMTSVEVRQWLVDNNEALPYKIRLERKLNGKQISWCHLDTNSNPSNPKVYEFDI